MQVPPVENATCADFEEYEELPGIVPLDFKEDGVAWVASNILGAAGTLGAEVVELINCLLRIGCLSEELRVVVSRISDWMSNSPPPPGPYIAH